MFYVQCHKCSNQLYLNNFVIKQFANKKMQEQKGGVFNTQVIYYDDEGAEISERSNKTEEKISKSSKKSIQKVRWSRGEWSLTQEKEYIKFLKNYRRTLNKQTGKRKNRVYKKMSEFICTRTNTQCTSHHQKMLQKYGSIQQIIRAIKQLCALKQLETENRSEILELKQWSNNNFTDKNLKGDPIQRNSIHHQIIQLFIEQIQSNLSQYQELYAVPLIHQLRKSQEIGQQQQKRKRRQSEQWKTYLDLS